MKKEKFILEEDINSAMKHWYMAKEVFPDEIPEYVDDTVRRIAEYAYRKKAYTDYIKTLVGNFVKEEENEEEQSESE